MDWKDIGQTVAKSAPLIGGLLGGPAGGAIGVIVASVLGTEAEPDKVAAALQADPNALAKVIEVEAKQQTELTRMTLEAETTRFSEQHQTIRAELASENIWKSGWRPFYGWASGVVWLSIGLAIVYSIIFKPAEADDIMTAMAELTGMFLVALSVLGVNIHQRSQDKRRLLGQSETGIASALTNFVIGQR